MRVIGYAIEKLPKDRFFARSNGLHHAEMVEVKKRYVDFALREHFQHLAQISVVEMIPGIRLHSATNQRKVQITESNTAQQISAFRRQRKYRLRKAIQTSAGKS